VKKTILRSGKRQYHCKECGRYFTEDSNNVFKQRSFPDGFKAFILYKKHQIPPPPAKAEDLANFLLKRLPFENKSISRMTIYRWDKKHWNRLKKHISWDESCEYLTALFKNSKQDLEPPKIQEYPEKEDPLKTYAKMIQKINKSLVIGGKVDYNISAFNFYISIRISNKNLNFNKIIEDLLYDDEISIDKNDIPPHHLQLRFKQNMIRHLSLILYSNGKSNLFGAKNLQEAEKFINKIIKKLSAIGLDIIENPIIKANNICATAKLSAEFVLDDVKTSIILGNELATHLNESDQLIAIRHSEKEKEGRIKYLTDSKLSYKFRNSGIKVEFYKSGKIVIRGVRDERGIYETVEKLSNHFFLKPFIYHSAG
jgi:TATA-box binding protein (TBP) (component of TFIID and TFIIIB)